MPADHLPYLDIARRLIRIRDAVVDVEITKESDVRFDGVLLQAHKPFSNARHLRQLLGAMSDDVVWLDRHADLAVLDYIGLSATKGQHKSFLVIREGRPEDRLAREAAKLRQELAANEIDLDLKYLAANQWDAHDRWILSPQGVWSLPLANALTKVGEMKPSSNPEGVRAVVADYSARAVSVFG